MGAVVGVGVTVVVVVERVPVGLVFLLGLLVFSIVTACASRAEISNSKASHEKFCGYFHLLLLMFRNSVARVLGVLLLDCRKKGHLDGFKISSICFLVEFLDLSYESFLLSQSLEVGQKDHHERAKELVKLIGPTPNEFEELEYVFPGEAGT
ncbi:hypothetical protein Tco_0510795 [Tanacetum coccineum]